MRAILWFLAYIAIFRGMAGLLAVALGFLLGELTAVVMRRRLRIDIKNGMPNGFPASHLIPFIGGIIFFVLIFPFTSSELMGSAGAIGGGRLVPLVFFSVTTLWGWATLVTVSVVDLVRPGQLEADLGQIGAGEVIGILERLATFVLVASGAFTAVGFVIAAKAAARFPMFKEKAFAEYFLIGTLTSVGMALLFGLLVQAAR